MFSNLIYFNNIHLQVLENTSVNKPEVERRKEVSREDFYHKQQKEGRPDLQDTDDLTSRSLLNEETGLNAILGHSILYLHPPPPPPPPFCLEI